MNQIDEETMRNATAIANRFVDVCVGHDMDSVFIAMGAVLGRLEAESDAPDIDEMLHAVCAVARYEFQKWQQATGTIQ